jgi:hypothetical protein
MSRLQSYRELQALGNAKVAARCNKNMPGALKHAINELLMSV